MYNVTLAEALFPAQDGAARHDWTIADVLRLRSNTQKGELAILEIERDGASGRSWTFETLAEDVQKLAAAMASRHAKGAKIVLYATNSPEWILVELASAMAGLVLVTANPSYGVRELQYILQHSGASAIYYSDRARSTALEPIVIEASRGLSAERCRISLSDSERLFEIGSARVPQGARPEDVIQIQYTSGTTGFPKGAQLRQSQLIQNGFDVAGRCGVGRGTRILHFMPLFHTAGCGILVLGALSRGATLLLAPEFNAAMLSAVAERERPKFAVAVPTMVVELLDASEALGHDIASLGSLLCGGAMVAPELIDRFERRTGGTLQIIYGQTELCPGIAATAPHDRPEDRRLTVGQPYPHIEVSIRNPNDGGVCGVDEPGEICCRGYNVMAGYHEDRGATAACIDSGGWLHTGDLGSLDARGYLRITGRIKEMIIRGGENLFPAEIEAAMLEHAAIKEAAVVGIPDAKWGEIVGCFMRAEGDLRPSISELRAFVRTRLSPQKTPSKWFWVQQWPLTGSGKIQKFKLREWAEAGDAACEDCQA